MAKAGRTAWRMRAVAVAAAATAALFSALSVRWDAAQQEPESEPADKQVEVAKIAPPAPVNPPPLPGNDSSVSAEASRLILTGTMVAGSPADSRAFLGVDPKNPQTYGVGSLLVNGTRIQAIARDHVMLERDGKVARLDIGGAWSDPPAPARQLATIDVAASMKLPAPAQSNATLTDGLGVSPVFDSSGVLTSYRLRAGRYRGVYARWGLESGDQLVAINGVPLSDTDSTAFMLDLVGQGERLPVTVLRNGERVAVVLDGQVIRDEMARSRSASEALMAAPTG